MNEANESAPRLAISQHPVFAQFKAGQAETTPEWTTNWLGVRTRRSYFVCGGRLFEDISEYPPPVNEEYFEWIDLLEAVLEAKEQFVMVELGAGWGRWLVRGAAALRQRRPTCPFLLVGVEAEPTHFRWLKQHFADNAIPRTSARLVRAACSAADGYVWFETGNAETHYGQTIASRPTWYRWLRHLVSGKKRRVTAISLDTLLAELPVVDLIDLDVQGAELIVLQGAVERLQKQVRRVHIGTHNRYVEVALRAIFEEMGWEKAFDYPCLATAETDFGTITFQDGVQSWRNPALR
jgi:FkbM family methyltransferase